MLLYNLHGSYIGLRIARDWRELWGTVGASKPHLSNNRQRASRELQERLDAKADQIHRVIVGVHGVICDLTE